MHIGQSTFVRFLGTDSPNKLPKGPEDVKVDTTAQMPGESGIPLPPDVIRIPTPVDPDHEKRARTPVSTSLQEDGRRPDRPRPLGS